VPPPIREFDLKISDHGQRNGSLVKTIILILWFNSMPLFNNQERITEIPICSSSESTFTSMRPLEDVTSPVPSSWIWSQEPWTLSVPGLLANCSVQITLFSVRLVRDFRVSLFIARSFLYRFSNPFVLIQGLVTTGPRDITLREPSSLIPYLMS
jgi:hypothetical protein